MRETIEALRERAAVLRDRSGMVMYVHGEDERKALQSLRAADLLESLSNPPETVEELERHTEDLLGYCVQVMQLSGNEGHGDIWVCGHDYDEGYAWEIEAPTVRAAWFAIVGMMEER